MKALVYHILVLLYYIQFNVRFIEGAGKIYMDTKPLQDNMVVVTVSLCTVWNLVIQQVYFVICIIADVTKLTSTSKHTRKSSTLDDLCNNIFSVYVFPFAVVISLNFWVLFLADPRNVDEFGLLVSHITLWDNHRMHSMPVVLAVIELLVTHKKYPRSIIKELQRPIALLFIYFCLVSLLQPFSTIWVYPFFAVFRWYHWLGYVSANSILTGIAYLAGKCISEAVWGGNRSETYNAYANGKASKLS